jgi:hypothetical protein
MPKEGFKFISHDKPTKIIQFEYQDPKTKNKLTYMGQYEIESTKPHGIETMTFFDSSGNNTISHLKNYVKRLNNLASSFYKYQIKIFCYIVYF